MKYLSLENINKDFNSRQVLKNISFSIEKGQFVSIIGKSGSGKSTLFNIIAGLEKADSGNVILNGKDITNKTGEVSYMLQKDLLFPYYTILDNAILPLVIKGKKKSEARIITNNLFKEFDLEGCQKQYPKELSGGMRQRAALLRTYLSGKDIILLDEPFSALDLITKRQMQQWYLSKIKKLNLTGLLITHDIEEAIILSDRILILKNLKENPEPSIQSNLVKEIILPEEKYKKADFIFSDDFLRIKKEISLLINEN